MAIQNLLTRTLGIDHPILLAPMDLISGGDLCAAVSNAGGLGLLGGGYAEPEWLEKQWSLAGNARIGCGFITWSLAKRPEALDVVLDRKPKAIMLSFGDPRPFASKIHAAGSRLICQVQTMLHVQEALEARADVIVAQGSEAGGHGMSESLFTLLPQVVDRAGDIPVVAAGGVADGRGLAAAIMFGAQGVLMGTRFYASQESLGRAEAKQRIVAARGGQTVRSTIFDIARRNRWPDGFTGRVLRNRFADRWLGHEEEMASNEEAAREYAAARDRGDFDIAAVIAGDACALIHDLPSAREIIERTISHAEKLLRASYC